MEYKVFISDKPVWFALIIWNQSFMFHTNYPREWLSKITISEKEIKYRQKRNRKHTSTIAFFIFLHHNIKEGNYCDVIYLLKEGDINNRHILITIHRTQTLKGGKNGKFCSNAFYCVSHLFDYKIVQNRYPNTQRKIRQQDS